MEAGARMSGPRPGVYRHFKGNLYQLICTAIHSETLERMAVYRQLYGDRAVWVRPLSMWDERVERDGYCGPRFTWVRDTETLLSMAEGVVPYEGPGVAWEMGWVPEGYEPMYRDEGAGAVQQVWVRDGTTLTWQYVTDPICPFETPEGEPEEIDLR